MSPAQRRQMVDREHPSLSLMGESERNRLRG